MEKAPESGESLSISEQLPSFTPDKNPKIESAPKNYQGMFAFFEKASLRTQQLVIASTTGVISSLVVAVVQLSVKRFLQLGNTALSQGTEIGLAALVTAIAVGMTTFALGQISTNQINNGIDHLQTQFNAVASGDLGVQATVESPKELGELATSFNQMTLALYAVLNQAQQKAQEQEKAIEDLQSQLVQLQLDLELAAQEGVSVDPEVAISEQDDEPLVLRGTALDFLIDIQNWIQTPTFAIQSSSTREEIQQHKEQLLYRRDWLEALLEETQREITMIELTFESTGEEVYENKN